MASSRSPSLESLPGANSIGSFGEPTDYLSDSPLTISGSGTGSSPPVSDSAICDDFGGLTSSVESQGSLSNDSACPRCTGCKSKQSDAVAKCITCNNYLCSNCVTAHQFMHCFDGHNVFRIATPSSALTSNTISPPLTTNTLASTNNLLSTNDSKLIMNGFDSHRLPLSINIKDEMNHTLMKSILNTITTPPPSSGGGGGQSNCTTTNTTNSNSQDNNIISNGGLGGFSSALTNGNGLGGGKTSSYFCVRHKNELLKFYCRTCGIPVCKDCIVIDHPSGLHECEHNSDNTPKQIENLLQLLNDVRNKANEMRSIIKNAEHNTARIQVQYQKAQTEINETFLFYRSMLDERKIELLKELESFYSTKNMSQSVLLTKSQDHVDKVLQSCEFVERLTKNAGMNETIMLKKLMDNKMQSFMSYMQDLQSSYELDFVSNYQAIQVGVRNTFGYIRSNSELSSSVTKQPPIARPTGMNSMNNNNCMNNGNNGMIGQNNMMTTNGSSTSSSNGSLNMHHQNHGMVNNGMSGVVNGHHNNSSMDRQLCGSNSNNGMMVGGGGGGNSMLSSSPPQNSMASAFDTNIISKRFNGGSSLGPFVSDVNMQSMNPYEKWSNGGGESMFNNITDQYTIPMGNGGGSGGNSLQNDTMLDLTSKLMSTSIFPPKSQIKRQKMIYHCKFGEFGVMEGQFTEPSGVAVNAQNDIIVADTNNHRIQIFDKEGRFKFQFGECGKRDGQLLYPNRVAVVRTSGDIIVTERSPTHQIQIYNQYGQFVRKFGANILQHPRGVTVDNKGRIIVVECKVMRVIIFDQQGNVLQKFGCSKHLEFPNGVVVNDKQEIFISDNRAHCVKVFNYEGVYLRQIGGEGITNYPIGVGINAAGEILIADNHNNFNLTIFTQEGQLVSALESKVKHAQCFDVALMDDGSVVLASKDYRLYIYRFTKGNSSTCNTPKKITGIYDNNQQQSSQNHIISNNINNKNYVNRDDTKSAESKQIRRDLFSASATTSLGTTSSEPVGAALTNRQADGALMKQCNAEQDPDRTTSASTNKIDNIMQQQQQTTTYSNRCHNTNDLYYERKENESKNAVSQKTSTNGFESDTARQKQQQLQQPVSQQIHTNNITNEEIIDEIITQKSCNHNSNSNNNIAIPATVGVEEIFSPIPIKKRNDFACSSPLNGPQTTFVTTATSVTSTPINNRSAVATNENRKHNSNNSFDMPLHLSNDNNNNSNSRKFASPDFSKSFSTSRRSNNSSLCLGDFLNITTKSKKSNSSLNNSGPSPNGENKTLNAKDKTKSIEKVSNKQSLSVKPKRRVVPLTISKTVSGRNEFTSSSFRSDNNLSNFMIEETEHSPTDGTRDFMRTQRDSISKDFLEEQVPYKGLHATIKDKIIGSICNGDLEQQHKETVPVDFTKLTHKHQLQSLAQLYSIILDMNLTTNILTELSFLINLLNAEIIDNLNSAVVIDWLIHEKTHQARNTPTTSSVSTTGGDGIEKQFTYNDSQNLFKNFNNCVYFALETLNYQRHLLASLDATTIRVLLENERLVALKPQLIEFLRAIHLYKVKLENEERSHGNQRMDGSGFGGDFNNKNVFYQQESDTRDNFPSDKSFTAFRKQRDMFYSILRSWEEKHLDSTFNFQTELGAKVKSLLKLMEHPINMAHLSKLFAAQLIISCNFDHSTTELKMALPNIDLTKLSKLRQRLVAPSLFSTQYLFPGNQSFFRDFIECTENNPIFIHQLKLCLINELIEMNNSSYEIFNIESNNTDDFHEYMVRPEFLSTMRILAKFIGFVVAKPCSYDDFGNNLVDSTQIQIRNNLTPEFDVKSILLKAICERKWIVTIPWIVQYLSMLDYVTLRLNYLKEVLYILYEFYISCAPYNNDTSTLNIPKESSFILRSCLGWLFEQPSIPEEYFGYRQQRPNYSLLNNLQAIDEPKSAAATLKTLTVKIPVGLESELLGKSFTMTKCAWKNDVLHCTLDPSKLLAKPSSGRLQRPARSNSVCTLENLNPVVEILLNVACPFLADFRVSMMPSKVTKSISRSGRYRHITTKFSGDSSITQKEKNVSQQMKLVEEFLNSQSLSVKKTVEFVVERTTSAVVKDFQVDYILKSKKQTSVAIKQIKRTSLDLTINELYRIYGNELKLLSQRWDEEIPKMIGKRNEAAFDALLPKELLECVTRTCKNIAYHRTFSKVNDWRIANMNSIELFSKDVAEEAAKLLRSAQKAAASDFTIHLSHNSAASFFERLQMLQHTASETPHLVAQEAVEEFLVVAHECLDKQGFSHAMLRNSSFMVLQLLLLLICYRPDFITAEFLECFMRIFFIEKLKEFVHPPQKTPKGPQDLATESACKKIMTSDYIFSNILSARYIQMLSDADENVYKKFAQLLVKLLNHNFLTLNALNDQLCALMKENWSEAVKNKISCMYQQIVDNILLSNGCDDNIVNPLVNLTIGE